MADMKAMMTKKLGPLPAWGWGVVIGGGYLGYRLISGKGLSMPAASASDNMADTSGMTAGGGSGTGSYAGESSGSYDSGQQSSLLDAYTAGQAASGKETQGSLLEAYQAGEATGLSLIKEPSPIAEVPPGETPPPDYSQPGQLISPMPGEMIPQPIKLAPTPKPAQQSSKGWKIWGIHWKDVAKKRTSTSAGRANTAAYKKGQAANKAKRAAATKKTGTSQAGFIKQKPKVLPPPHRNDTKIKPATKPAPKKAAPKKAAPKKAAPKKGKK